jgi:hypothetical protein
MLHDADDIDGYAFALGALAHYVSDVDGHPAAANAPVGTIIMVDRRRSVLCGVDLDSALTV